MRSAPIPSGGLTRANPSRLNTHLIAERDTSDMKNFFKSLIFGCFLAAVFIFSSLYVVDPLGLNYFIKIPYVNAIKPQASSVARKLKPFRLISVQPTTILFGNSRAAYGVDPDMLHEKGDNFYNMAIEFCQPYEMLKLFEHAIKYSPVQKAIFFFDYSSFGSNSTVEGFDPQAWECSFKNVVSAHALAYFSDNAVKSIFETILYNTFPKYVSKGTTENGYVVYKQKTYYSDFSSEKKINYAQSGGEVNINPEPGLIIVKKIQSLCDLNKIECLYVIPPFPRMQLDVQSKSPFGDYLNEWKLRLKKIGKVYDFYNFNYNVSDDEFIDHVHFKTSVGNKIIEEILSNSNASLHTAESHF